MWVGQASQASQVPQRSSSDPGHKQTYVNEKGYILFSME